jgi:hypothetical protein
MSGFDNAQAASEGWVIANCYGSENGPWQLQKIDEMDAFLTDVYAWRHVVMQSIAGSAYHRSALEFLKNENPQEHLSILRTLGDEGI